MVMVTFGANLRAERGFTLIELLISLALGVVVVSSVAGMYLETKRNIVQDEEIARMQENGRYAVKLLKRELSLSGFFGGSGTTSLPAPQAVGADCTGGGVNWALDTSVPMEIANDISSGSGIVPPSGSEWECIDSSEIVDGSDVLAIKRTADGPTLDDGVLQTAAEDSNQWYLKASEYSLYEWNYLSGTIPADEAVAGSKYSYWEYYAKLFFLRDYAVDADDGIPTLCEQALLESSMTADQRCLVEGIEDMQFEVGVDSDGDDTADIYTETPALADLNNAVSIRFHLLVRSVNPINGYTNKKSYQLGQHTVNPFNDSFMRKVFTTTVRLRNAVY